MTTLIILAWAALPVAIGSALYWLITFDESARTWRAAWTDESVRHATLRQSYDSVADAAKRHRKRADDAERTLAERSDALGRCIEAKALALTLYLIPDRSIITATPSTLGDLTRFDVDLTARVVAQSVERRVETTRYHGVYHESLADAMRVDGEFTRAESVTRPLADTLARLMLKSAEVLE